MDIRTRRLLDLASRSSLFVYACTAVALPVSLVAITREFGFSLTQAGSLSLITSIISFGILLGSIVASARFGKIRLLRISMIVMALGLAAFTGIINYATAVLTMILTAVGQSFLEALLTPLVEDIHPEDNGRQQILLHSFWPMGVVVSTLVVGEALSRGVDWRLAFWVLALLSLFVSLFYPNRNKANLPRSRADFSHAKEVFANPIFWLMGIGLALAGGTEGGFTFWTASYIQLEFDALPRAGAMGTAAFAVGMAVGRLSNSRLAGWLGLKRILILSVTGALICSVGFLFIRSVAPLFVLMTVMGFFIAPFWPGLQTYAVRRTGADPTMVMIFLSCFGVLGFSSANFLMGVIGDLAGLRWSFLLAPALLLIFLIVLFIEGFFRGGLTKTGRTS